MNKKTNMTPQEFLDKVNRPLAEKIEETKQIIEKFKNGACVSYSGGKDSTPLSLIANEVVPNIPIVHFDTGAHFPEMLPYIQKIVKKYKLNFHYVKTTSWWALKPEEMLREDNFRPGFNRPNCCVFLRINALKGFMKQNNLNKTFSGSRWDDSPIRRFAFIFTYGIEDTEFQNIHQVFPLAWWNINQIWEYHIKFNIPKNPIYDKKWTSLACWTCPSISEYGLSESHPDLYTQRLQLKQKFPDFYNRTAGYDSFETEITERKWDFKALNPILSKIIVIKGHDISNQLKNYLTNLKAIWKEIKIS